MVDISEIKDRKEIEEQAEHLETLRNPKISGAPKTREFSSEKAEKAEKISQDQLYNLLVSRELSWQEIIYDLIASEQLDPWDIDISLLSQRYIEKIRQLEEASFFISSKILLAAAILLRIKSEILLEEYIRSIDEILFGKPEEKQKKEENIDLDLENSELFPKTPLPRFKKVTLQELVSALDRAMITEQRRIRKEISMQGIKERFDVLMPKRTIKIREKIREVYDKIINFFGKISGEKMTYSQLVGDSKEEKLAAFLPVLHLDSQSRINLEQLKHFDEIYISLQNKTISEIQ